MIKTRNILIIFITFFALTGCKKFLDMKSDSMLVIPDTPGALQALLDNFAKTNRNDNSASEASADDYYLSQADFNTQPENYKRMYTWEKSNFFGNTTNDWSNAYDNVFIANTVLDNVGNIKRTVTNESGLNDIKGQALFLRSKAFLEIATVWSLAYDQQTASTDLGIPLRLSADITESISRSNTQATYDKILTDLKEAGNLLVTTPFHPFRASKPAAFALLARTYLSMRQYDSCSKYANMCLQLKSTLLDYNSPSINPAAVYPFGALLYDNPEIIYASRMLTANILSNTKAKMDSLLYKSYSIDDLRRTVYFSANAGINAGTFRFKGSLDGIAQLFSGVTTAEVYLMRAECFARKGMVPEALTDLNLLIKNRWKKNTTLPIFSPATSAEALKLVLTERRKELVMRGLRWMDIKRLNKEGANIALKRNVNSQESLLAPNGIRYALPIPEDVISISGMSQNPR